MSKAEEVREELDSMKARIEIKMTRTASNNDAKLERAKAYNEKH